MQALKQTFVNANQCIKIGLVYSEGQRIVMDGWGWAIIPFRCVNYVQPADLALMIDDPKFQKVVLWNARYIKVRLFLARWIGRPARRVAAALFSVF